MDLDAELVNGAGGGHDGPSDQVRLGAIVDVGRVGAGLIGLVFATSWLFRCVPLVRGGQGRAREVERRNAVREERGRAGWPVDDWSWTVLGWAYVAAGLVGVVAFVTLLVEGVLGYLPG